MNLKIWAGGLGVADNEWVQKLNAAISAQLGML